MRYKNSHAKSIGKAPGSVIYTGRNRNHKISFTLIEYDGEDYSERELDRLDEVLKHHADHKVRWLNISGIHDELTIKQVCDFFNVHPLIQEDIVNVNQRAKIEVHDEVLFAVMKMITYERTAQIVNFEQISFILRHDVLITFQEQPGDVFASVRKRIETKSGRIRTRHEDYLFYALLDAIIDSYYETLESVGDHLESLDDMLLSNPTPQTLNSIRKIKREVVFLRKSVWPVREMINILHHQDTSFIAEDTQIFIQDLYDHTVQVIDLVETFKDLASGMLDTYNSVIANRMNEIMKVLTVISTIFIPLTFIAGVYGMNFQNMPELYWHNGYFVVLGVMAIIAVIMVFFFRKRSWL
jgi:magnesium transporter